jgi:hypothetical protein
MTDDEIKIIAQQVVERLLPAIEEAVRLEDAVRQQARYSALFDLMRPMIQQEVSRQAPRPAPRRRMDGLSKVIRIVTRTAQYAGQTRYGQLCAQGLMPRSYLLKLSRLTADECRAAVDQAIAAGQIEKAYDPDTGLACVRALNTAQTPAQAPTQPQAPAERDYGPLDDPAQDAHEWDFATALAKARERDSWS